MRHLYSVVTGWSEEDREELLASVAKLREAVAPREQSLRQALARSLAVAAEAERLVGHLAWLLDRLVADPDADGGRSR
jgi:hypothetical protein